jgi:hypothetical protein
MLATNISAVYCLSGWVSGVASSGTFVKHPDMNSLPSGTSGIPNGWTVEDYVESNLITFTIDGSEYQAEEGMTWADWVNSEYNTDGYYIGDYDNIYSKDNLFVLEFIHSSDIILDGKMYIIAPSP